MDRNTGESTVSEVASEEKDSITAAAREAVRAYYLGEEAALAQAMEALNSAFENLDGIDYKRFSASQLLRLLGMFRPGRSF